MANMVETGGEPPVVVIFRVDKEGVCFALFPELKQGRGHCTTYERVGQHSSGPYGANVNTSRPAKPEEYAALKRELEGIGYNLIVRQRWIRRRA